MNPTASCFSQLLHPLSNTGRSVFQRRTASSACLDSSNCEGSGPVLSIKIRGSVSEYIINTAECPASLSEKEVNGVGIWNACPVTVELEAVDSLSSLTACVRGGRANKWFS